MGQYTRQVSLKLINRNIAASFHNDCWWSARKIGALAALTLAITAMPFYTHAARGEEKQARGLAAPEQTNATMPAPTSLGAAGNVLAPNATSGSATAGSSTTASGTAAAGSTADTNSPSNGTAENARAQSPTPPMVTDKGAPRKKIKLIPGAPLTISTENENIRVTNDAKLAREQVASYPDSPEAHFVLAVALTRTSQVEEALKEIRIARNLSGQKGGAAYFDKMIGEYENMLGYYPSDNEVRYHLAWAYYMKAYVLARYSKGLQQAGTIATNGAKPWRKEGWEQEWVGQSAGGKVDVDTGNKGKLAGSSGKLAVSGGKLADKDCGAKANSTMPGGKVHSTASSDNTYGTASGRTANGTVSSNNTHDTASGRTANGTASSNTANNPVSSDGTSGTALSSTADNITSSDDAKGMQAVAESLTIANPTTNQGSGTQATASASSGQAPSTMAPGAVSQNGGTVGKFVLDNPLGKSIANLGPITAMDYAATNAAPEAIPQIKTYYKRALKNLDDILESEPDDLWANLYRAHLRAEYTGDIDSAIQVWEHCRESHPNSPAPYFFLGEGYLKKGDLKQCLTNVSKAIALRAIGN